MKNKKVLIITYYWPPAGGPGVQRWLKFVKYLPDYGYSPVVYIPENPNYPLLDEGLLHDVPEHVDILRQKIIEPYGIASLFSGKKVKNISSGIIPAARKQTFAEKMMLWLRGNIFIPDARMLWVKPSVRYLADYIRHNNIDVLVTTGPPHSLHLIGLKLQEKTGVRWVADFRDPWTTIGYHKSLKLSRYARNRHLQMERKVLTNADQIIVTSNTTKSEFALLSDKPIEVITNGYDYEPVEELPMDSKFSLAHIGSLLSERNPLVLWQALKELTEEDSQFAADLEIKFAGAVSTSVMESLERYSLVRYVRTLGYISHREAVAQQRCSQVLLLVEIDSPDTRSIIPGKLFEYMSAERPILAIGPEGSDIERILNETYSGKFFLYGQVSAIKEELRTLHRQFQNGTLKVNPVGLQQYSRKKLTQKLAAVLETVINSA